MRKKFLGIVCIIYSLIFFYVWIFDKLKNFLSISMQNYLKVASIFILIFGIIYLFVGSKKDKFKVSDLVLLLPILFLIFSNDAILDSSFASNRVNYQVDETEEVVDINEFFNDNIDDYDFSSPYFDITDPLFQTISMYMTSSSKANKFEGKTIRLSGMAMLDTPFLKDTDFMVGKYVINCCAADALFNGFIIRFDRSKVKSDSWYMIEGVLHSSSDSNGHPVMIVNALNVVEIDSSKEEKYVYPCYSYDGNACEKISSYDLKY